MRRRLATAAVIAGTALSLSACATMRVSSHVEQGLDFTRFRTFDWGPADALPTGDPRLDRDPFFQDHVQGAIEKQMAARGYARSAAAGPPDLRIHYHATIDQRLDINEADRRHGYCTAADCRPGVFEYEAGTLVVDIVDLKANKVVWRGWAQDSVEGVLGNQDRLARQIDDAVTAMFRRLPATR
jgi:hypothetical protein